MAYNPTNWENLPNTTTPINKTNLNKIEQKLKKIDNDILVGRSQASNSSEIDFSDMEEGLYIVYGLNSSNSHYKNAFSLILKSENALTNILSLSQSTTISGMILNFYVGGYYSNIYIKKIDMYL